MKKWDGFLEIVHVISSLKINNFLLLSNFIIWMEKAFNWML